MNKSFYFKLAGTNLKNNSKFYLPYIITSICSVMMLYILIFLADSGYINKNGALAMIMMLGSIIIGIFSVIILFYTNSFLIKRRKKEIGLYNILGMEKRNIGLMLAAEQLVVSLISIVGGLILGVLFSRLMLMLLGRVLGFPVGIEFTVSVTGLVITAICFAAVFTLTLLFNLCQIKLSHPAELLRGGQVGEREPRTKWILAIIGTLMLGIGYYIAIATESPVDALGFFFVAVLFVILGTYCLFTAGSIAILKGLRRNKNYFYQPKHFTSVSGMLYRMKQNAVGLANICILSTMVIVMLSTTSCLFIGLDDALRAQYPQNISLTGYGGTTADEMKSALDIAKKTADENGVTLSNFAVYRSATQPLRSSKNDGCTFDGANLEYSSTTTTGCFIPLVDYNLLEGKNETLARDEVLYYSPNMKPQSDTLTIGNRSYKIKSIIDSIDVEDKYTANMTSVVYLVMADDDAILKEAFPELGIETENLFQYIGFDADCEGEAQKNISDKIYRAVTGALSKEQNERIMYYVRSSADVKESFLEVYGGLFFLGIFLSILFVTVTVLIIYYKQISEGYDDKERFEIMQKVGMSRSEVRAAIRSQVLTVFFLPLVGAIIHLAFAFKMITKMLLVLNLTNISLFIVCTLFTVLLFSVFYVVVYLMTARTYYKIVES